MSANPNRISTHILDMSRGKPAANVPVRLEVQIAEEQWRLLNSTLTDQDGRCSQLLPESELLFAAVYRLIFDTGVYFAQQKISGLYPQVEVRFEARERESHFHIPLLLSPNGYTTYRGS